MSDIRKRRADALDALSVAGKGYLDALAELLAAEIDEAHAEMETADTNMKLWRFQGRAIGARGLLSAINTLRASK